MLVVDLHCEQGHLFEGWFASGDELRSQKERGLLSCPVCASTQVERRPSASRLNVSALRMERSAGRGDQPEGVEAQVCAPETAEAVAALQTMYLQAVRHVLANTEDVGDRFVEEVRSMHRGDAPERAVRGQADRDAVAELKEEGIDVWSMPVPAGLKGPLQ